MSSICPYTRASRRPIAQTATDTVAEPPDLRKPAGRTLCPSASSQGERAPRQGRRTTHRRRLSPHTGDIGFKERYFGASHHDDRGDTRGAAASCRGPPPKSLKAPARPRHYPSAPDTRKPQADGVPRYLPSQHDSDLPDELVTLIDLPCTPEVPGIHLPWTGCAAPGRAPAACGSRRSGADSPSAASESPNRQDAATRSPGRRRYRWKRRPGRSVESRLARIPHSSWNTTVRSV